MTKEQYEMIAASLHDSWDDAKDFGFGVRQTEVAREMYAHIVHNLAMTFSVDSDDFDEAKFLSDSGIGK